MCGRVGEPPHFTQNSLLKAAFIVLLTLLSAGIAGAQAGSRVTIAIVNPDRIKVDAELSTPADSWSFRNAYAGVLGIAERIEEFSAVDADVRKAAVGEYRSERKS